VEDKDGGATACSGRDNRGCGTLVGLTGGASSASTVAHSSSVVTLQFWNAYNDVTETPVMNGVVIPSFESQNPASRSLTHPSYAGIVCRSSSPRPRGDPPDLMRSDIAWVPQLASEGTLLEPQPAWFRRSRQRLIRPAFHELLERRLLRAS